MTPVRSENTHGPTMTEAADIKLSAEAAQAMRAAACDARPRETGGILIGWRGGTTPLAITVCAALVVDDPTAGHATYLLDRDRAQAALDAYLTDHPDPDLGYVGEWHSHPAPQPPSPQDLRSLRASARLAPAPVALVVPALDHQAETLTWHGRVAERRSRLRPIQLHSTQPREQQP